ncbi:MAG: pilus assembly protein PilP [Deltaproteobacteria bacterium]|jgi:type IV pilus assembly protein PilP|nr:pilus assembly protein PilP [Deltaproteobacteria bacterium]
MNKYLKLASIVFMTVFVSLSIAASASLARSKDKPVVVRKKIEARNEDAQESIKDTEIGNTPQTSIPAPRSDLVQSRANKEVDSQMDEFLVVENKLTGSKKFKYNPKGKVDPFEPLFNTTAKKEEKITFRPKPPPIGHIPGDLEKIDLSQLKLTGIVISVTKNLGLVQETSGKGHIISKGSRIGTRGGRVSDILKDKVIIKETLENTRGNIAVQKTELKLKNTSN